MTLGTTITPRDSLFHQPPFNEPTWLETNWFSFIVPERHMRGHIVQGFRTNLGVVFSIIMIWSKDCENLIDFDYWDSRMHLPMPRQNLDRYQLDNGLTVINEEPLQRWHLTYEGFKGTTFDLHFEGLMPPVDSHETKLPEGRDFAYFHAVKKPLADAVGHIDQTHMVNGTLVLRGEEIPISFPSNHDRTWGPRPEYGHALGNFDEGYFGTDLMFHVQTINSGPTDGLVTNGYIVDKGELHGLKAGVGRYTQDKSNWFLQTLEYELEDDRGKTFRFRGDPVASAHLPSYPNQYITAAMTKWTHDGEVGWGEYKWHWEVSEMMAERRKAQG